MSKKLATTNTALIVVDARPLDQNPAAVYIASLPSANSRRNMKRYLNQIAEIMSKGKADALALNWGALGYQHTTLIRSTLIGLYAPATVNGMLSALRGVLKDAWRLGYMTAEDYQQAVDFKTLKVKTLPAGRSLSAGEILALLNACMDDPTPAGARDAAIIGVLATTGLRRAELVALELKDFDAESGEIAILDGKGNKSRLAYAENGTLDALRDWLSVRGDEAGALFCPVNKSGKVTVKTMTSQVVYNMLEKRRDEAGVKPFSPHDFRRTFAGDLLDLGVDLVTVQNLMGHSNANTTGRYDRRPGTARRAAVGKLHFPYVRRVKNA